MNDAERETFRQALLRLRAELLALEQASGEARQPVALDQSSVGRLSRLDAMQVQQMALETSRRRLQQLAELDGALRRIDAGDYGSCFACGEEIDPRRLAIAPTSTRCIRCAQPAA